MHTSRSITSRARHRGPIRRWAALAAACLLPCALGVGCGAERCADSPAAAAALVGERPVTCEELEIYLARNLFVDPEAAASDPAELNRVKSRLLDALLDERIFLVEAERRGLVVSDSEIDPYLVAANTDQDDAPVLSPERNRRLVRQRLLVQKLQEAIAAQLPPPSEAEVAAFARYPAGRPTESKRLRLRALRFESAQDAARVAALVHQRRMSFAEAVVTYETDPGQGLPLELSWNALPVEVRRALEHLDAGDVSDPVVFHGDTFLFRVDAWLTGPNDVDEQRIRDARDELGRRRLRDANQRLLGELRETVPVRIHTERLTFRYLPEAEG